MKTILFALLGSILFAQTQHSATLTWVDDKNPAGTTYNVYRSTGLCSGSPVFNTIGSAIVGKSYVDDTVTPGNYCYQVTAVFQGMESSPSNSALATIPSFAPTNLSIQVR